MKSTSSKNSVGSPAATTELDVSNLGHDTSNLDELALENAEVAAALAVIVSAFVDLGFGASAAHHALSAANRNHSWKILADDFLRNAA